VYLAAVASVLHHQFAFPLVADVFVVRFAECLQETQAFSASNNLALGAPLAVSGTLAGLDDASRQKFLDYCPEMKMMFPSLHNSACFGAEPNAPECFKYLCITSKLRCGEKFTDITFLDGKKRRVRIHIGIE
jgi:hypothetical protein